MKALITCFIVAALLIGCEQTNCGCVFPIDTTFSFVIKAQNGQDLLAPGANAYPRSTFHVSAMKGTFDDDLNIAIKEPVTAGNANMQLPYYSVHTDLSAVSQRDKLNTVYIHLDSDDTDTLTYMYAADAGKYTDVRLNGKPMIIQTAARVENLHPNPVYAIVK